MISAVLHLLMLVGEHTGSHASQQAAVASRILWSGRYSRTFWWGAVLPVAVAAVLGAVAWAGASVVLLAVAGVIAQPALLAYESVFVRAGQDPPLSYLTAHPYRPSRRDPS